MDITCNVVTIASSYKQIITFFLALLCIQITVWKYIVDTGHNVDKKSKLLSIIYLKIE